MGTAFLYVDYSTPVETLRQQLNTIVHASPLWDNKVCGLQVTNLTDRVMEARAASSAPATPPKTSTSAASSANR